MLPLKWFLFDFDDEIRNNINLRNFNIFQFLCHLKFHDQPLCTVLNFALWPIYRTLSWCLFSFISAIVGGNNCCRHLSESYHWGFSTCIGLRKGDSIRSAELCEQLNIGWNPLIFCFELKILFHFPSRTNFHNYVQQSCGIWNFRKLHYLVKKLQYLWTIFSKPELICNRDLIPVNQNSKFSFLLYRLCLQMALQEKHMTVDSHIWVDRLWNVNYWHRWAGLRLNTTV